MTFAGVLLDEAALMPRSFVEQACARCSVAGVLLDEAALMPRSFVEQACARCSVPGSRLWFNCNPAGPTHWLYTQWVQQAAEKNCLRLHFTMADNPSLTEKVRRRYERLYDGVFYQRYVLGLWVQAEGRVYDFFTADMAAAVPRQCDRWYISCDYGTVNPFYQRYVLGLWVQAEGRVYDFFTADMAAAVPRQCDRWYISCDYGTVNPTSMGLWGRWDGVWYRVKEFYFDSRREGRQMTDGEYAQALAELAGDRPIQAVIVDPSAASFLEVLRRLPQGGPADDRRGICPGSGGTGRRQAHSGGDRGPVGGQLPGGAAPEWVAGEESPQRCAGRHPAHQRAAETGENPHLHHLRRLPAGNGGICMGSVAGEESPQRCAGRHPAHQRAAETGENPHLHHLRRLPAGNGGICMGSALRQPGPTMCWEASGTPASC